ncbi:hypothetical protein Ocin01_11121 [Orchesella cincta]|uniref:TPPC8 C-terminal Ig-like domain-containing protein n=1 Tax=Orchesella cincta TaxID=48709 RepID=A0A1D2MR26_ORCCI|nr:hypothetical protein Ocin01_11121 [Orchesella cincta]
MTVSQVIITMDNMEGVLQVLQNKMQTLVPHFLKQMGKNFTRLKCEKTESPTKIPCVFKAPHTGETAVLDILLVYEILHNDDASKKAHRVIRMSIQIPLSPAVHLEYSSLKMLDCINYLGLLRLYNLTVDYSVVVSKIFFTPSDIQVTELCSSSLPEIKTEDEGIMKMNKNESRNIVLKFQDQDNRLKNNPRLTINVAWQIAKSTSEYLAEGNSEINISEAIASIQSSFVFQVKHTNKVYADFEDSSTCECEIQLLIHSKTSGNFSIQLEYNPPKNDITSTGPSTRASGQVSLGGKTTANLELQALQTETIKYNLNVAWPGVYNAAPKITVTDEERGVQESYSLHSPIIFAQALPSVSSSL